MDTQRPSRPRHYFADHLLFTIMNVWLLMIMFGAAVLAFL